MNRLDSALAPNGHSRLVAYVTAGDPDAARSQEIVRAVARGGADVIEVGVPFSDPIADGPVIQRASERALRSGATLGTTLALVRRVRTDVAVPIVLFTYVNPVLRMGISDFVARASDAGVDGVLLLDLPIEESAAMRDALAERDIDQIFLVSPTTTDQRLREAARLGRGFLYAISRLGVTGARAAVATSSAPLVARIRAASVLPIALGFGISTPEHVRQVSEYADAAVVGSALVQVVADAAAAGRDVGAAAEQFVAWLKTT
ncbi:MAG: tryptophan synthase subunit alpha [Vicinamibacterales bacterium]